MLKWIRGWIQYFASVISQQLGHDSPIINTLRIPYDFALHASTGFRGMPWTINGVNCFIEPRFRYVGRTWEPEVADYLRQRIQPGQVVFNVGAFFGIYVIQFANWMQNTGSIFAFEANPLACDSLLKHMEYNQLNSVAECINVAVGDREGQATLFIDGLHMRARLDTPYEDLAATSRPITVHMTTIDAFVTKIGRAPDWILIDIAGYELSALKGAIATIESQRGKLGIIVEMYPNIWEQTRVTAEEVADWLASLNLEAEALQGQFDPLREPGLVRLRYRGQ